MLPNRNEALDPVGVVPDPATADLQCQEATPPASKGRLDRGAPDLAGAGEEGRDLARHEANLTTTGP